MSCFVSVRCRFANSGCVTKCSRSFWTWWPWTTDLWVSSLQMISFNLYVYCCNQCEFDYPLFPCITINKCFWTSGLLKMNCSTTQSLDIFSITLEVNATNKSQTVYTMHSSISSKENALTFSHFAAEDECRICLETFLKFVVKCLK